MLDSTMNSVCMQCYDVWYHYKQQTNMFLSIMKRWLIALKTTMHSLVYCLVRCLQGRIQDLVLGGAKFSKVIWEYYYYCLRCLWNVWCKKIKIDLQVIMIIWGEETEPLFSFSVFFLLHLFFCVYLLFFFGFLGGANVPSAPLWIRQWLDSILNNKPLSICSRAWLLVIPE